MIKCNLKVGDKGIEFRNLAVRGTEKDIANNLVNLGVHIATSFVDNVLEEMLESGQERVLISSTVKQTIIKNLYSNLQSDAKDLLNVAQVVVGEENLKKDFKEFISKFPEKATEGLCEYFESLLKQEEVYE